MGEPELTVLIDARNVLRSRWPNVPEERLVELCSAWAAAHGFRAVVVFDGEAPGGLVGERALGEGSQLVGTARESADEWLTRTAAHCRAHCRRHWLVTSDRALREAAGKHAERVVGGGTFLRALEEEGG